MRLDLTLRSGILDGVCMSRNVSLASAAGALSHRAPAVKREGLPVIDESSLPAHGGSNVGRSVLLRVSLCLLTLNVGGCGALNPAFLAVLDPEGTGAWSYFPNAPGHVVVKFINNAEIADQLITYLESSEGGNLSLTDVQKRALRPRFRFNLIVTFEDGTTQPFEFENGAAEELLEPTCAGTALGEFPLDNMVMVCDIARLELDPASPVEVFVPVEVSQWELQQFTTGEGGQDVQYVLRDRIPCGWRELEVDDDPDVVADPLQRNIDRRKMPAPVSNPLCGSVITLEVNGQLSVPFLTVAENGPSYDVASQRVEAGVGGHYEFEVKVR